MFPSLYSTLVLSFNGYSEGRFEVLRAETFTNLIFPKTVDCIQPLE